MPLYVMYHVRTVHDGLYSPTMRRGREGYEEGRRGKDEKDD